MKRFLALAIAAMITMGAAAVYAGSGCCAGMSKSGAKGVGRGGAPGREASAGPARAPGRGPGASSVQVVLRRRA